MLRMATVALAGGLAEELIFGAEHASAGRSSDRERATSLVLDSVRRLGFGAWGLDYGLEDAYATDASVTEPDAEALLCALSVRAVELLRGHRGALIGLGQALASAGSLTAPEVADILGRHGIAADVRPEGFQWSPPYAAALAAAVARHGLTVAR